MKKIFNVAAFVCGMDEEYPYQIIQGINRFAKEHSMNISYFASFGGIIENEDFDAGEYSIYDLPDYSSFDGALLLTNTFSNPFIREAIINKVRKANIPVVIFECKEYEEFYDVSIDNYTVMKKLVMHLIKEHDCKVFDFIAGPDSNPEAQARYKAFRDVLDETGIGFDEQNRLFKGCFRSYDGIKAVEEFVRSGRSLPDAFVCANDSMALTLMNRLQNLGYKIPRDVIVTGFDNTFNARNAYPTLTTVKRPLFLSGEEACGRLLSLIEGKKQSRSLAMPATPVFTESCGCEANSILDDIYNFKKEVSLKLEMTYTSIHVLNRLIADLAGAKNIETCADAIDHFLKTVDCDDFALCLVSDWAKSYNSVSLEDATDEYPIAMTAPFIREHGERKVVQSFASKQLLPEPLLTSGNISYFIPLHFGSRILGYYIMSNTDFPIYSNHCHTITMSISNAIENISKLNILDPLCGIYNRNGFNLNADYVFKDCVASKMSMSIMFIDVDGLKIVNDTYGHADGDFVIKTTAEIIESSCGSMDVCGRIGGDEFVVIGRGDKFVEIFEQRFNDELDRRNKIINKPYQLSVSIGHITVVPDENDSLSEIIQQADAKMYQVKKTKKQHR